MVHCKNCINWLDESLAQIEADHGAHSHIFMGCRIFGPVENNDAMQGCKHYLASENLFTICSSCHLAVPKVCVSLGECANCTDTDLFCVDSCMGGESRKYCTHFVRLHTEGVHLIDKDQVFDLFPTLGMPGRESSNANSSRKGEALEQPEPRTRSQSPPLPKS
jgi:hypothetical protein